MKKRRGFSLIEVAVAILVCMVVVLAGLAYRYHAALEVRRADIRADGARLATALLEGWRSAAAPAAYDPVARYGETLAISASATGPDAPTGFTVLGSYQIVVDRAVYYATLAYKLATATAPAALHVVLGWRPNGGPGDVSSSGQYVRVTSHS